MHAADEPDLLGSDVELLRVDQIVADMDVDHAADLHRRIAAERETGDALALEADRRLGDARRLDPPRRHLGELGDVELFDLARKVDRADVHALGD